MVKISVEDLEDVFWNYLSECLNNLDLNQHTKDANTILQKKKALIEETLDEKVLLEKTIDR